MPEMEPRVLHIVGKHYTTELWPQPEEDRRLIDSENNLVSVKQRKVSSTFQALTHSDTVI